MAEPLDVSTAALALSKFRNGLHVFKTFVEEENLDSLWSDDAELEVELLETAGLERGDAISLLRELSEAGVGRFTYGRHGNKTRLEVRIDGTQAKKIIQKATGIVSTQSATEHSQEIGLDVSYHLRPDFEVKLVIPNDFNHFDAERLKRWIDTLPFD